MVEIKWIHYKVGGVMKNIIEENEKTTVNTKEIEILKKNFLNCFYKDG